MGASTSISWTDATWTPIRARRKDTGKVGVHCEKVSAGCQNCYSQTFNRRTLPNQGTGLDFVRSSRDLVDIFVDEKILTQPLLWRTPKKIFVCSQTDLFAEFVTDHQIDLVFAAMGACDDAERGHAFQILTKRPARMREYMETRARFNWNVTRMNRAAFPPRNVWLGVSVEDRANLDRIDELKDTPAAVRFISFEPLLQDLGAMNLSAIHWAIVGGESGPGARPLNLKSARSIVAECKEQGVACFVKQTGRKPFDTANHWVTRGGGVIVPVDSGWTFREPLNDKKGGDPLEWPEDLRVREFPR